jgi:hypothetical protein
VSIQFPRGTSEQQRTTCRFSCELVYFAFVLECHVSCMQWNQTTRRLHAVKPNDGENSVCTTLAHSHTHTRTVCCIACTHMNPGIAPLRISTISCVSSARARPLQLGCLRRVTTPPTSSGGREWCHALGHWLCFTKTLRPTRWV